MNSTLWFLVLYPDGLPPVRIVASMRRQNVSVTPRDIYNIKQAERRRVLGGRSSLAALLDSLEGNASTPYFTQFDNERKLNHLLIVSASAKEICSKYSANKIWLIDSTYKTNRFGLPLAHGVGVTATGQSFTFAYCFMSAEGEDNYFWAVRLIREVFKRFSLPTYTTFVTDRELALMNALDRVFPDANFLLCRWHISKNILSKQRKTFA